MRWDTSVIGSGSTVTAATLKVYVISKQLNEAGRSLVGDYYDFGSEPTVGADWVETASPSIFTAIGIGSITAGAVNNITLTDLSGISRTGYTGIRLTLSSGAPTAGNTDFVQFATREHATFQEPRLSVTWTGGGQTLRPDADITTSGWTTTPLFSKINEASADGTVITATAS